MLFIKTIAASFFISLFISYGELVSQTDSSGSFPIMFEMKNGEILFGGTIAKDSDFTRIQNTAGQKIQLRNENIKIVLPGWNQQSSDYLRIYLNDGEDFTAKVNDYKDSSFMITTASDIEMKIPSSRIEGFKKLRANLVDRSFAQFDPNRTRLFLSPTARTLDAGEGYFSDFMIFFPSLAIGISDFLTISGGVSLITGAESQMIYGNIKAAPYQDENFAFSTGILYLKVPDFSAGILYGVATFGTNDNALTLGFGNGFTGEEGFSESPIIIIGGEVRIANSTKLISENWIPTGGEEVLLSLGIRFFGEHVAGDFAFITAPTLLSEARGFPLIPWLGFTYNFGY